MGVQLQVSNCNCNCNTYTIHMLIACALKASFLVFPTVFKQLLDKVFVISRIIKVEVGNKTLIILDITKPESNNCLL